MALRPEGGLRRPRRDWPRRAWQLLEFSNRSQATVQPMNEKQGRPALWEDLLFAGEMALRKASKLWPKRHLPGDHDRLKPAARAVLDRIELCGMQCFGKSSGRGPMVAPNGAAGRRR